LSNSLTDDPEKFKSPKLQIKSYRLKRFYRRTLVAIFAPLAIFIYYLLTYQLYLRRDKDDPVKFGLKNGAWVFYSWFVIGVMGLGISQYGLLSIEAAMLQERTWQANNAMVVLMHSGSTWSGPGGWMKILGRLFLRDEMDVGYLWYFLALLSMMPFIALPLSGLCMGLSDGYVESTEHPMVIGRTWENFNHRALQGPVLRGTNVWNYGFIPKIPGIGIAYTRPGVDRSQYSFLKTLPNTLPLDKGTPELFLAQQATVPINGRVWGLLLSYNCSVVQSASEFTILPQRSSIVRPGKSIYNAITRSGELELRTPTGNFIYLTNSSYYDVVLKPTYNLWAYAEMGLTDTLTSIQGYNGSELSFLGPDGRLTPDNATVMEYAIWQVRFRDIYPDEGFKFNTTIDTPLAGMGQILIEDPKDTFSRNKTFFLSPAQASFVDLEGSNIKSVSAPIGVRCLRGSILGTAEVDARTSTFTSFQKTLNPYLKPHINPMRVPVFGENAASIIIDQYTHIFTSASMPPPRTLGGTVNYPGFLQASNLIQSVLLAHAADALQLMYDGIYGFDAAFPIVNATSSSPAKVLDLSVIDPRYPIPFLAAWAILSAILGVTYGFRRRWSDSLDGYSLFRFGADFEKDITDKLDFSSTRSFEECGGLRNLPGLVGDSRMDMDIGHISLVEKGNIARKGKEYT
jgi:hypothetical protein